MIRLPSVYDVIVIGAGHAGCEAALAASKMGCKTILLTMNFDTIAQLSCNPAIGGPGKGQVAREIGALGGIMADITDAAGIQFRMLNTKKGPAVWAPRAQADKNLYHILMKQQVESQPLLDILQFAVEELMVDKDRIKGVVTQSGLKILGKTVIVTPGTFLNGLIHIGDFSFPGGRMGEFSSQRLAVGLKKLGFHMGRLKTGTPARIHAASIDYSKFESQAGDKELWQFSCYNQRQPIEQVNCYLGYTTLKTHQIIRRNLFRSPLYTGKIKGTGVRYCPSIEDKVVRFRDKDRHQIFLEPEGRGSAEIYINGLSTSLPQDVQIKILKTIDGLQNCRIMRFGYGIEYDYADPTQLFPTLETKLIRNLYFAGQINGTTGYEEAGCQGLMAGINAGLRVKKKDPFVLSRTDAYIGVLIDDLVTKGTKEPYRLFASRVEHRLVVRQDNADLRLAEYAHKYGLLSRENIDKIRQKQATIKNAIAQLHELRNGNDTLAHILRRPGVSWTDILRLDSRVSPVAAAVSEQVEIEIKYQGYIERETALIAKLRRLEQRIIPADFAFNKISGLKQEAREKLSRIKPRSIGQAMRISGITANDVSLVLFFLERERRRFRPPGKASRERAVRAHKKMHGNKNIFS